MSASAGDARHLFSGAVQCIDNPLAELAPICGAHPAGFVGAGYAYVQVGLCPLFGGLGGASWFDVGHSDSPVIALCTAWNRIIASTSSLSTEV